jgi:hypothetical protein
MVEKIEKAMVDGNRKIFYTEATGLGKSYIFMYLVRKYFKDKKVLYICPKYHIWYNMNEYKEFELIKDCVTMKCYADFNKIKNRHLGYDVIFIDEAHHLSTDIRGKNIITLADTMMATNPNAYMFGFTATPYVDGKFIGDEYFETSVIGMDLFDAIDNKILQKIHYAVAVKEDMNLSEEEKSLAIKYNVDTTRMMVANIVNQYSNVNHWLAYFPYIDELDENIKYFEKYFPEYKIFSIHSEIENSDKILKEFEKYEGKAILASVSMVLEGIHPKSVEGILLYRNVCTNNTFFQIIGRLGIMKSDAKPICIDIYSSYNNLINESNIINEIDSVRNTGGKKCMRDYIYMSSNTYRFLELSEVIHTLRYGNIHEYRGIIWTSDADLSRKLGKCISYVSENIRNKGKTHEQIIDHCLNDTSKIYRGITWSTNTELSRKLGMYGGYVGNHIKKGKTYEQIIDEYLDYSPKIQKEYRGITWVNMSELSQKIGKRIGYVSEYIKKGKTYEQIIDEYLDYSPKIQKEYRGITWTTNTELSRKLGKEDWYVSGHINHGKTHEEIIDYCIDHPTITQSYRGLTWTKNSELSRQLGKTDGYVSNCICKGKSYKEIIDACLDAPSRIYKPKTYRNITWQSNRDLSIKLGKSDRYVSINIRKGKTYEEIIDKILNDEKLNEPKSYRNITWTTDRNLSIKLGKYQAYVNNKIHEGKTYEEIIDNILDNKFENKK